VSGDVATIHQPAAAPAGAGRSTPRRSRHQAGRRRGRRRRMRGRGRHPASSWTVPSAPATCPRRLSPPAASTESPSSPARSGSAATVALCNAPRRTAGAQPDSAAYRRTRVRPGQPIVCSMTPPSPRRSSRPLARCGCRFTTGSANPSGFAGCVLRPVSVSLLVRPASRLGGCRVPARCDRRGPGAEDHAGSLGDHVARRSSSGDEARARGHPPPRATKSSTSTHGTGLRAYAGG
jgi:hypothetical protein